MGYNSKAKNRAKKKKTDNEIKKASLLKIGIFASLIILTFILPNWIVATTITFLIPSFFYALFSIKDLLDIYFPVKPKVYKYKNTGFLFILFLITSFISMLVLFEEDVPFSNTPMLISIGIGLILCVSLLITLYYSIPNIYTSSYRRFTVFSTSFFAFPFLTMGIVSHLNIALASEDVFCENIILRDKSITEHDNYEDYNFYFLIEDKEVSYSVSRELWQRHQFGDLLEICYTQGYFGYDKIALIDKYDPMWDQK